MIIYTCNTNNYVENLPTELPEGHTYIVFGMENPPSPWEGRPIHGDEYTNYDDPVWASRMNKILCPFEQSVYIDATMTPLINENFINYSEKIFSEHDVVLMQHPHKHTFLEECAEYLHRGFTTEKELDEFIELLEEMGYFEDDSHNYKSYVTPLCTIMWRQGDVSYFNEIWWDLYEEGCLRDQLACGIALQTSELKYKMFPWHEVIKNFTTPDEYWSLNEGKGGRYSTGLTGDPYESIKKIADKFNIDLKWNYQTGTDYITNSFVIGKPELETAVIWDYKFDDVSAQRVYGRFRFSPEELKKLRDNFDYRNKMVIYTCITNGYDTIPHDNYYDPDVYYVCFTDGTVDVPEPWDLRPIPIDHPCPRRLSSFVKINPHKVFPVGTKTVWIDGCYKHTKKWVQRCKKILSEEKLSHMLHPHRYNYHNEVMEGFACAFNTKQDVIDITKALYDEEHQGKKRGRYKFDQYSSPVLACIWREISEEMFHFHDLWWHYSLIGPNRDQISFDAAKQFANMKNLKWNIFPDWTKMDIDFIGDRAKINRKKLHPQAGEFTKKTTMTEIYQECRNLLSEIRPMTKIDDDYQFININTLNIHSEMLKKMIDKDGGENQLVFCPTAKKVGKKLVLSIYSSEYMRKKIKWCWGWNFSHYVKRMLDSDRLPKS